MNDSRNGPSFPAEVLLMRMKEQYISRDVKDPSTIDQR